MFEDDVVHGDISAALTYASQRSGGALPIRFAYEPDIIAARSDDFIAEWLNDVRANRLITSNVMVADVPKGKGLVRPVHVPRLRDEVILTTAGLLQLEGVKLALGRSHRYVDYSYVLREPVDRSDWFYSYYRGWSAFKRAIVDRVDNLKVPLVVHTDIVAFYENVDHAKLYSLLRAAGSDERTLSFLRRCLNGFMPTRRGLPQSQPTSHLLAKYYLAYVDEQMNASGQDMIRYSDDIRLFCSSIRHAKVGLLELARRLREVTLSIQSSKTEIKQAPEARTIALGVSPLIEAIRREYDQTVTQEVQELIEGAEYLSVHELITEALEADRIPVQVIVRAYEAFILNEAVAFDKSVFHYLLGKLGAERHSFAVSDCLARFVDQPEETSNILAYFQRLELTESDESMLFDFLEHSDNVYAFQTYEFLKFFAEREPARLRDRNRLLSIARRFAFGGEFQQQYYVRSWARRILGSYGTGADIDSLRQTLPDAASELETGELLVAIRRQEPGLRNTVYAEYERRSLFLGSAVSFAKRSTA